MQLCAGRKHSDFQKRDGERNLHMRWAGLRACSSSCRSSPSGSSSAASSRSRPLFSKRLPLVCFSRAFAKRAPGNSSSGTSKCFQAAAPAVRSAVCAELHCSVQKVQDVTPVPTCSRPHGSAASSGSAAAMRSVVPSSVLADPPRSTSTRRSQHGLDGHGACKNKQLKKSETGNSKMQLNYQCRNVIRAEVMRSVQNKYKKRADTEENSTPRRVSHRAKLSNSKPVSSSTIVALRLHGQETRTNHEAPARYTKKDVEADLRTAWATENGE